MEIPNKVRIGSIDYDNTKIKIANNIQSKQKQEQTFLHEVVHAITREFKIDFTEDEETVVDKLALGLHQVIRDNLEGIKSIKVGDIQINYGAITDKVSEKMSEDLIKSIRRNL